MIRRLISLTSAARAIDITLERIGSAVMERSGMRRSEAELWRQQLQSTAAMLKEWSGHEDDIRDLIAAKRRRAE